MVNIRIRVKQHPTQVIRIGPKIGLHVFVDFLLQINSQSAVRPYHFVRANSSIRGDVPARIGDSHISRIVADKMMRAVDGSSAEPLQNSLMRPVQVFILPCAADRQHSCAARKEQNMPGQTPKMEHRGAPSNAPVRT
jgi:hypothetical protein